jgi:outer membrane protein assembly factor BamD
MVLTVVGGCTYTEPRLSAKQYFVQATASFNEENFADAIAHYTYLLEQYPLNPYSEEAQLKIAYAYYLAKDYPDAIIGFGDFERMYPISSHMPFVEYYRGMCYLRQMRSVDRDQGVTEKALYHFQRTIERYPNSPFASIAQEKIRVCWEALAGHQLYVADFYVDYYNIPAALFRLRDILENYPDTKAFLTAISRLEEGFRQAGRDDLAALAKETLAYYQNRSTPTKEVSKITLSSPSLTADDIPPKAAQDRPVGTDPRTLLIAEIKKMENRSNGAGEAQDGKAIDGEPTPRLSSGQAEPGDDVDSKDGFR